MMGTEQHNKPEVLASDQHQKPETTSHTEAKEHPSAPKSPAKTTDEEQSPKAQQNKEPKEAKAQSEKSNMEFNLLNIQSAPEQTSNEEKVSSQNLQPHISPRPYHQDKLQPEPEKSEQHPRPKSPQEEREIMESKESEKVETGVLHEGEEIQGSDGTKFRILKVYVKNLEASKVHCINCDRKIQKKSIENHITTKTHQMNVQ